MEVSPSIKFYRLVTLDCRLQFKYAVVNDLFRFGLLEVKTRVRIRHVKHLETDRI